MTESEQKTRFSKENETTEYRKGRILNLLRYVFYILDN